MTSRKSTIPVPTHTTHSTYNLPKTTKTKNSKTTILPNLTEFQPDTPQKLQLQTIVDSVWQKALLGGRIDSFNTIPYLWFHNWVKKDFPIGMTGVKKGDFKTSKNGRLTKDVVKAYLTSVLKLSEEDNLNKETLQETLSVLNGSLVYASNGDSPIKSENGDHSDGDQSDSNENLHKGDGFEVKIRSKSDISSSGASSYTSIDKYDKFESKSNLSGKFTGSFQTPVKTRANTINFEINRNFEDATLTPKSPKIGGDNNSKLAMSPAALEEYQTERESEISSLCDTVSMFKAKDAINAREIKETKSKLTDAREFHEELIEQLRQKNHEFKKKSETHEYSLAELQSEKVLLEIDNKELIAKIASLEHNHSKQISDYESQITLLDESINSYKLENMNNNDKISCLTHDKLKLEVVLEEASQEATMSPDSKLSKAVADCKKSKSNLSRLNKTCDDMDWWREKIGGEGQEKITKSLKSVRKPFDFNEKTSVSSFSCGENLGDFIPQHKFSPLMKDKSVETEGTAQNYEMFADLEMKLRENSTETALLSPTFLSSSLIQGSLFLNVLFFGFILYLAMFTGAREFLIELGVLKVEYNPEFSKYF